MTVLTPTIKTKAQQKKYLAEHGLELNDNLNANSRFRVMGTRSVMYGHHLEQDVEVITTPYTAGHTPETKVIRLVNLGTYFTGVTATNFFVRPRSYDLFTSAYTRHDYTRFKQQHNQFQTERKLSGETVDIENSNVFCTSNLNACYEKHGKVIVQPVNFVRSNPSGSKGIVMHFELYDTYCTASQNFQLSKNLNVVRYIMQGDEERVLIDKFSGEQVENVDLPFNQKRGQVNIFDLHHIKVVNGRSADKNGKDPAVILRSFDLSKQKNNHHIIELMKCMCLSKNTHALVHAVPNSNLHDYDIALWPWVLQSEENFNQVVSKYNLDTFDYKTFISGL